MSRSSELVRKSRQHHVWQEYLRSWCKDERIYCLQNNRVFPTGTRALGVSNDFYKVPPLTEDDIRLIQRLALDPVHPIARKTYEMVLSNLLMAMRFTQSRRERIHAPSVDDLIDIFNTNVLDNQHTVVENAFRPLLACALNGDITWYDDQRCVAFCYFIGVQHMRTRGAKERTVSRLQERMNIDISRIWGILALIYGMNIGCSLFLERKKRALMVVRNHTVVPFVTGDQPVINVHGDGETSPEMLSLYYPLSPRLALYLGEPGEVSDIPLQEMTAEAAAVLNLKVARACHKQVYAQTADLLEIVRTGFGDMV